MHYWRLLPGSRTSKGTESWVAQPTCETGTCAVSLRAWLMQSLTCVSTAFVCDSSIALQSDAILAGFEINIARKLQSYGLLEDVNVVYKYLTVLLRLVLYSHSVGLSTISVKNKSLQLKSLFILFRQQRMGWIKNNWRVKSPSLIKHETKLFALVSVVLTGGRSAQCKPGFGFLAGRWTNLTNRKRVWGKAKCASCILIRVECVLFWSLL